MLQLPPIEIDPSTFLYHHCVLPTLPTVLVQFQEALHEEEVSINHVVEIISRDQSIVAEVLKVVNSAYYSLPREVSRIAMAVAYLGINEVHNIVLTAGVLKSFSTTDANELKKLWQHSLLTALCSRYLAQQFDRHVTYGDLWAPALLHDIGKLVYLKFFPDHYQALRQYAEEEGCLFDEAAAMHNMPLSSYIGGLLCDRWRLPRNIKDVCERQGPDVLKAIRAGKELKPLHRIVVIGDLIAVLATQKLQREKQLDITGTIMEELGLTEAEFLIVMGTTTDLKMEADRLTG